MSYIKAIYRQAVNQLVAPDIVCGMPTLVITGGHHNSALVVAQELVKRGVKVVWFGHRRASRGDTHDSAEYLEVKANSIPFHNLQAGKIDSTPTFSEIANIPLGFFRAAKLLKTVRPDAVISFGGYLGLTTALPAYFLGIPVYLHEQTVVSGRANRLVGLLARHIFLTWESSKRYFPARKVSVVGLPLRQGLLSAHSTKLFPNNSATILVMGGKQGSHIINKVIFAILSDLLSHYNVIHQTGTNSATGDYEAALNLKNSLPDVQSSRYHPVGYLGETEVGKYLASADLYLGRSGVHIAYELLYFRRRSLLIPYPHTPGREQLRQANLLASQKLALILPEHKLSGRTLLAQVKQALELAPTRVAPIPLHASLTIVDYILADL